MYKTTIVVSVGESIGGTYMDRIDFVFPGMGKRQWKVGDQDAVKVTEERTKEDLFARSQHPSIEIPEPHGNPTLVLVNGRCGFAKFIQRKTGQVESAGRFGNGVGVHR